MSENLAPYERLLDGAALAQHMQQQALELWKAQQPGVPFDADKAMQALVKARPELYQRHRARVLSDHGAADVRLAKVIRANESEKDRIWYELQAVAKTAPAGSDAMAFAIATRPDLYRQWTQARD